MMRKLAWAGAVVSGLYLLTAGPMPDPLPILDEGLMLALFVKCMGYLGYDLRKWLPSSQNRKRSVPAAEKAGEGPVTIDV